MNIAVLDDDREDISRVRDMIFNIQGDWRVDQYLDCASLVGSVAEGKKYDLLFCGTEVKGESGIELVGRLRNMLPGLPVAFVTESREHAVDAYSLEALHYLIKPVRQDDIVEVFRRLNDRPEPRRTLTVRIDRALNVLFQDEIIRVESHGHNTVITCVNDTVYSIRKPYYEIDAMLDGTFVRIKNGVTLNMGWITRMTARDCTTRDGYSYLLRREDARAIRERYDAYLKAAEEKRAK